MASPDRSVALVTATGFAAVDTDLPEKRRALEDQGVTVDVVVWDDPGVAWERYDAAVVCSPWDYVDRRDELLRWAERVDGPTRLANPASVLRWNTDKRYLLELRAAGVPIVPTRFVAPGDDEVPIPWPDVVVKPTVSAGARRTGRYRDAPDEAVAFARKLQAAGHHVMIQPYVAAIDAEGEVAVCVFGDRPSHAVVKHAVLAGDATGPVEDYTRAVGQVVESSALAAAPLALVDSVLDAVPGGRAALLYARIDCVTGPDGTAMLMEAELTEPSFFLPLHPGAAATFAGAVRTWIERPR